MKRKKLIIVVLLLILAVVAGVTGYLMLHARRHEVRVMETTGRKVIYQCPMHPQYLSDKPGVCPICGMKLVPVKENAESASVQGDEAAGEAGTVRIDPTVVQNIGVVTETAAVRDLTKEIRASTTIELDETAISAVNTKVMGWVEKLYIDYTGQSVRKGQPLLTIYSPDLVSTQEEYLQALRYLNTLSGGAPEAGKSALELVESSKRRLLNWDIPEGEIDAIAKSGAPQKIMTVYSPAEGVVLEKMVVSGQNVTPGGELYKIGDLSTVWAMANVYREDLPFVKLGTKAVIDVPSATGGTFTGRVEFISPVLDAATKTAAVRISIRNTADFNLKPQMFANVTISSPVAIKALSVSQNAVLHTGRRDVVIVSLGNGYFKPRDVKLGVSANGCTQVLSGLTAGETIVTSSQFLIDAESNLKEAVGRMGGDERPVNMDEMKGMER